MFRSLFRLCLLILLITFLTVHFPGLWVHLSAIILATAHTVLATVTHVMSSPRRPA